MSHEIKPHWGTIGYSAMNVPLLLRTFVCKVFFVHVCWQSQQRLAALSTPLLCVSLAFITWALLLLRISVAFLCCMTFVFQSRFASPDSWSKVDAPVFMACLKNSRKGCVMLYKGGLTFRKIETLKLTLLVCRPFLGRSILREKKLTMQTTTLWITVDF